ncbi:MAG: helix-turn-helix domain-containing protein [Oscillospiraceae bacterium]
MDQLVQYLNRNYTKKLTSGEISERFEMNFDYLNRVFSAMTGSSIFSYINMLRINNAKQLIASTDLAFSEIAYLVGIRDRYYFSRLSKADRHEPDGVLQKGEGAVRWSTRAFSGSAGTIC